MLKAFVGLGGSQARTIPCMLPSRRPKIFGMVGWRRLTQLASTATSQGKLRWEFEAGIPAGERVTGKEIVRTWSSAWASSFTAKNSP